MWKSFSIITKAVIWFFICFMLSVVVLLMVASPGSSPSMKVQPPPVVEGVITPFSPLSDKGTEKGEWSYSGGYKVETEKQYKASCKLVSGVDDGRNIYYKEFLKNPTKFTGERLTVYAKIASIEEADNKTAIQVHLSPSSFDIVIVYFEGIMKIYDGDIIKIHGEGAGVFEGQNRMGASMSAPVIKAKYIRKERSEN